MLAHLLLLASLALAELPADPAISQDPVPGWVEPVRLRRLTVKGLESTARQGIRHLVVDDQLRLEPGRQLHYVRGAYLINTREGLEDGARIEVDFDPSYEHVHFHSLKVLRGGEWSDRLATAHGAVIEREEALEQQMLDGTRTLVLVLEDVRVGDVVAYAYTLEGSNPVFGGHFAAEFDLAWSVPVGRRFLRLSWKDRPPVRAARYGGAIAPTELVDGGYRVMVWDLRGVPAFEVVDDLPVGIETWPWVQLTDFGSWAEVVDWALPLYGEVLDEDLGALARRIAGDASTPEEQALRLLQWVQDELRYFGIEEGAQSHAPRDPRTVLARRYGDCKDKSVLLVALLRSLGMDAVPALVSQELHGAVAERAPSPTVFDHVIVRLRLDGREYWLDPTLSQQGGDLASRWIPPFGKALPIAPGQRELVDVPLPELPDGRSTAVTRFRFYEGERPPWAVIRTVYEGVRADDTRSWLADLSPGELVSELRDSLPESWGARPVGEPGVEDRRGEDRLVLRERYRLSPADSYDLSPLLADDLDAPPEGRGWAWSLPLGLDERERIFVEAPSSWELPEVELHLDDPWFSFDASTREAEGGRWYDYHLQVKVDRVEPADFEAFRRDHEAFRSACSLVVGGEREPAWRAPLLAGAGGLLAGLLIGFGLGRRRRDSEAPARA